MARRKNHALVFIIVALLVAGGCRATVKTVDPSNDIRYTSEYSYTDLKTLSSEMARRILASKVAAEDKPPVFIVFPFDNRTSEHIDTRALADAIRTELFKSGKFQFINEAQRKKVEGELNYQAQGYIAPETRIQIGKQVGAKYMLTGSLVSIGQDELKQVRIKKKSLRYYRLTLEISDLVTNLIVWTDEQEIVREQAKPFVGW